MDARTKAGSARLADARWGDIRDQDFCLGRLRGVRRVERHMASLRTYPPIHLHILHRPTMSNNRNDPKYRSAHSRRCATLHSFQSIHGRLLGPYGHVSNHAGETEDSRRTMGSPFAHGLDVVCQPCAGMVRQVRNRKQILVTLPTTACCLLAARVGPRAAEAGRSEKCQQQWIDDGSKTGKSKRARCIGLSASFGNGGRVGSRERGR